MDITKLREIDKNFYERLPPSFRNGEYLILPNAMFHYQSHLNELNAVRFIINHPDASLSVQTILDLYGALVKGTAYEGNGFKQKSVIISSEKNEHLYVTLPPEETPAEMEKVCREYEHLNRFTDNMADDMIRLVLIVQCIHPFADGNGRLSSLLLQFLMYKAGLKCAPILPLDFFKYGQNMYLHTMNIVYASGAFYGQHPIVFDRYIEFMSNMVYKSYRCLRDALERYELANCNSSDARNKNE
jgi:Fic family protein